MSHLSALSAPRRVFISGGGGDLGRKLTRHLLQAPWCAAVVSADLKPPHDLAAEDARVIPVAGDLCDRSAPWQAAMAGCDAVVHFAAQHPHTDASWADAGASYDMTAALLDAALDHGVGRFVFASSNHVMGGYKDAPLASDAPGFLTAALPPSPGTKWNTGTGWMDSTAYATAKFMGERAVAAAVARAGGALSAVNVRIGWVQPGENRPETINISGDVAFAAVPEPEDAEGRRNLKWYRNMWLSNRDFARLFEAAIAAPATAWPAPLLTVNGVSGNTGTGWDLSPARTHLGYAPEDDLGAALGLL